jgi:hypothetical protein
MQALYEAELDDFERKWSAFLEWTTGTMPHFEVVHEPFEYQTYRFVTEEVVNEVFEDALRRFPGAFRSECFVAIPRGWSRETYTKDFELRAEVFDRLQTYVGGGCGEGWPWVDPWRVSRCGGVVGVSRLLSELA